MSVLLRIQAEAFALWRQPGLRSHAEIAARVGVNQSTVSRWVKQWRRWDVAVANAEAAYRPRTPTSTPVSADLPLKIEPEPDHSDRCIGDSDTATAADKAGCWVCEFRPEFWGGRCLGHMGGLAIVAMGVSYGFDMADAHLLPQGGFGPDRRQCHPGCAIVDTTAEAVFVPWDDEVISWPVDPADLLDIGETAEAA